MTTMRVVNGTATLGGLRSISRATVKVRAAKTVRPRRIARRARDARRSGLPAEAWSAWYERV